MVAARRHILWLGAEPPGPTAEQLLTAFGPARLERPPGVPEGLATLAHGRVDAVVASFPIPGWTPAELLEEIQRRDTLVPVLIRDEPVDIAQAVRLARMGAHGVLDAAAPAAWSGLMENAILERERREQGRSAEPWRRFLVGESRVMEDVARIIRLVGARRCTVLITGESGTGKEMAARALHLAGPRGEQPLVAVSCSALPEQLLEAELFGHVKGAFTGAVNHRVGRFEQAHGSTLFLDEIGDMPLDLQPKLLRVLQEREFQRLGSSETVQADVRVVAATNADLLEQVERGRFREDLYYRLNVVPIHMPALRERPDDIALLVYHFIDKVCRLEDIPLKRIAPEALERLARQGWPGNVRQLENAVEVAIALSGDRAVLMPADFPLPSPAEQKGLAESCAPGITVPDHGLDFERTVSSIERSILEQALRKAGGNKKMAADMLGLKRTTLAAKLRSLEAQYAAV